MSYGDHDSSSHEEYEGKGYGMKYGRGSKREHGSSYYQGRRDMNSKIHRKYGHGNYLNKGREASWIQEGLDAVYNKKKPSPLETAQDLESLSVFNGFGN